MPTVTDWISSIGSLVGGLTGIGALVVAILSYLKSNRALAADAETRGAVGSTVDALEALGQLSAFDVVPDVAREAPVDADRYEAAVEHGPEIPQEKGDLQHKRAVYEKALDDARRQLRAPTT